MICKQKKRKSIRNFFWKKKKKIQNFYGVIINPKFEGLLLRKVSKIMLMMHF
jgi:hypothetical protein